MLWKLLRILLKIEKTYEIKFGDEDKRILIFLLPEETSQFDLDQTKDVLDDVVSVLNIDMTKLALVFSVGDLKLDEAALKEGIVKTLSDVVCPRCQRTLPRTVGYLGVPEHKCIISTVYYCSVCDKHYDLIAPSKSRHKCPQCGRELQQNE